MQAIKPDHKTLFVLMAMGLLLFVGWLAMRSPAQLASTATVTRGPLEVVFQEEGKTRIKERYVVATPVAGTVRRIMLQPGDTVQAGQTLAEVEAGSSSLLDPRARSQAHADIRAAGALLAAARQRIVAAQAAERLHKPMCAVRGFCSPWAPLRSRSWIRLAPEGMPHGPNWPLLAPTKRQARRVLPPPVRCCQMKGGQVFPVVLARSWPSRRRLRGASSSG